MGFGRGPMTEQIDADHWAACIGQKIGETASFPCCFVGPAPTVDKDDGMLHIGQDSP